MKINIQRALGTFEIKQMGSSETDGERRRPRVKVKLKFLADPDFIDAYLDGHESGAQPSSVFWREYPDQPGQKFIRYGSLGRCELAVPADTCRYVVKITTRPPDGMPQDDDDYHGYREFLVPKAALKKAQFEVIAKAAGIVLVMELSPLHEHENVLTDLRLEPEVLISVWNEQNDLFDRDNMPNRYEQGSTLKTAEGEEVQLRSGKEIDDEMLERAKGREEPEDEDLANLE